MRRKALIVALTALLLASIGYQVCGTKGEELGKSEEGRKKFVEVQILLTKGEYEEAYTRAEKLIPEYAGDYQISLYVSFWARVFRWQDVDERRGATRPEPPGIGARIQKMKDKKDKDVLDLVKLASLEIEQSRPYLQELLRRFPDSVWKDWAEWMLCHTKFVELNEKYRDKNAQEGFRSVIRELYDWGKRYIEEHPGSYMLPCAFDAVSMWRGYLAEGEKADEEKKRADEEIIELSRRILRDYPDAEYYRAWARATLRRRLGGDAPEVRSYSEKEDRAVLKFYVHVWPEHEECVKEYLEIKQAKAPADAPPCTIVVPEGASFAETLAAKEVRRYVYLTTGALLPLAAADALPVTGDLIVVSAENRLSWRTLEAGLPPEVRRLKVQPQQYVLHTVTQGGRKALLALGSDDAGVLYAAYRFAEHLGVRFYLDGDVVPDAKIPFVLPDLGETGKPLFETRGIQPFHDFPEGPDWWNLDDYKAYISQLVKLRMNFFGLHTYPEGNPNAEPTVWIGLAQDLGEGTKVKFSYPASWQNTLRGNWGYNAKKTSEFSFGAADLFDRDDFGADVMRGFCPQPSAPEACNELFDRAGAMLAEAFKHARRLGVKTCVGTETPLIIPKAVQERLKALGKDPRDKAVMQELYEGIFKRLVQIGPPDYYWFWTPEGWTWGDAKPEQVQATLDDLAAAVAAARKVKAPFTLATCGWVLGPQNDRALFDKTLPKDMPMSCINREVGKAPVEPGFAKVVGRPKWAIPWMEDDPNLCSVQLWVGRMRKDAADARKYGCTGLLGIHWRTRVLGPNVSALAQAAWDQSGWNKSVAATAAPPPDLKEGPEGGQVAAFPQNTIAGTDDPALYQTVRYNLSAYHFNLPAGKYTVRLQFCEPYYQEAGKRVFGVRIQNKQVIENLDIFAKVGQNKALDCTFKDVEVRDGGLDIQFVPETEFPSIAAIAVEGPGGTKKVNCGGPAYKDYAADPPVAGPDTPKDRVLPAADFYRDWALHQFGPEVAKEAAAIFEKIDGRTPEATGWTDGPGGIGPNGKPVDEVLKAYTFVGDLEKLRPQVRGAGNLERFDYWLSNFRYMMAVERLKCAWAKKDEAAMKQALADVHRHLLATVTTPGELGTVANWQQHNLPRLNLAGLEMAYRGPVRVIVPTARTSLDAGETLNLRVIILAEKPPTEAFVFVRPLGKGEFTRVPLAHVARGVYSARITPSGGEDFEYYVEAAPAEGNAVRWPVTAPGTCQTVVVTN